MKKIHSRKLLWLVILLIGTITVVGCNDQNLVKQTIKVETEAQESIADAHVKLIHKGQKVGEDKTNEKGILTQEELPSGEYKIQVSKEGYQDTNVSLVLEQDMAPTTITLSEEKKTVTATVKVKDQAGNLLDSQLKFIDNEQEVTKESSQSAGVFKIKELSPGDYQVKVSKEGYNTVTKELTIEQDDLFIINLEEKISQGDLIIDVTDNNHNQLPAKVTLKQNGKIKKQKDGSEVEFLDLVTGEYEITISRPGYEDWTKKIKFNQEKSNLDVVMEGGRVEQYLIDSQDQEENIVIKNLAKDEETIVALSYLNWNNLSLDEVYDVRKKGNQLVEKYGANFVEFKADYSKGARKEFSLPEKVKQGKVTATLEKSGQHINVFVADNKEVSQEKLDTLVKEFDNQIYPGITGTDTTGRVEVLLTDFADQYMTGYFDPADLYPKLGNEGPIFYLNPDRAKNTLLTAAAHQYQHLFFFAAKAKTGRVANDAWIDQALAQLAPQKLGYINPERKGWSQDKGNGWVYSEEYGYLNNSEQVNLLIQDGSLPFMGGASLFANYLTEQYSPQMIKKMMTSSEAPIEVIEEVTNRDFNKIYLNWITTNLTDSLEEVDNPIYNYTNFDLQEMPKLDKEDINKSGVNYFKLTDEEGMTINPTDIEGKLGIVVIRKKKEE